MLTALCPLIACVLPALFTPPHALASDEDTPALAWYLPGEVTYDSDFPTPASVLGWEVGQWHVRHDQLVAWYRAVAEASPRMRLETYGHTHEQRPLLLATVSAPENLARIEEIRAAHVERVLSGAEQHEGPNVVWMGYSVHGNESSGSNAALLLAYHLAAAEGEPMDAFLRDNVVLIDPCVNPDGLSRFAHWANANRGVALVEDPMHREHREGWPSGRTNHYWFDLNRDWLLATHPESQGRLKEFHRWLPSVLTDYHEMGSDSTYFFQPGIPSRQNPLTPGRNLELTRAIAAFHAEALDEIGSLYYTEESFDDFYYGKGSTYPDINGCIGILFEQASSRGHLQENSYGGISFPFTIKNQFTTSLSTLRAAHELGEQLGDYQRGFYRSALEEAEQHGVRAYVFGAQEDPGRTQRLVELLRRHQIRVHRLANELEGVSAAAGEAAKESAGDDSAAGAKTSGARTQGFAPASAFIVPLKQPQFRLIRALFETRTSWQDNTFYDVSSWTLPLSFDVPTRALGVEEYAPALLGEEVATSEPAATQLPELERPVAWLFEWHHYEAPRALQRLLEADVRARVATRRFRARTSAGERDFDYGTIVVPTGTQSIELGQLRELMQSVAADGLAVHAATSGLTPGGVDLGSGSLRPVDEPRPVMLVGGATSSYEAGEAWHYLDQRLDMPLSMVDASSAGRLDMERYTHLLLVGGASGAIDAGLLARLRAWLRAGGVLVATKSSAVWAAETFMQNAPAKDGDKEHEQGSKKVGDSTGPESEAAAAETKSEAPARYEDYEDLRAVQRVAGTIFRTRLDRTHPLAFGYVREELPVFRNFTAVLPEGEDPFGAPVRYTDAPLISGFASPENIEKIAGTPAVRAARVGSGCVIALVDNPNFRGVWYGTSKLFANALYFGSAIKRTGPVEESGRDEGHGHGHGHQH